LKYSNKPICFVTYEWEGTSEIIEMLEVVAGGAEQLRISPTAILYLNPTTAFRHNEEALRKLMYAAEKGLPAVYLPDVQRGFSCPMTYAGGMACANAGQLLGLLLAQLVNEGAPIILNAAVPSTIDMKTMVMPYVEPTGRSVSLEMNFYYNLPAFSTGGCSDSKLLDEQAIRLTGSLELVVICDEIISWLKASMQGLEINAETLALDVIHELALSGDFLEAKHTLRHVREDWQARLVDRQNYENWLAGGGMSMRERARAKIDEILGAEQQHLLPLDVEKRIRTITEAVQTK